MPPPTATTAKAGTNPLGKQSPAKTNRRRTDLAWKITACTTVIMVSVIVGFILIVTAPHYCIGSWVPGAIGGAERQTGSPVANRPDDAVHDIDSIDPCDIQFIEQNFSEHANRIAFMCSALGRAKKRFRDLRDEQACHHYIVQISILLLGALATVFVAMRDTNEHFARLAIIPTALVTLMTGLSALYGFQDRFLTASGVANTVAVMEGKMEYSLLTYADRMTKEKTKIDNNMANQLEADLVVWRAKLEDTLSGSFSDILKAMGGSTPETDGSTPETVSDNVSSSDRK